MLLLAFEFLSSFFIFISFLIFLIYFINHGANDIHVYLTIVAYHIIWVVGIIWFEELTPIYITVVLFFVGMVMALIGTCMSCVEFGCRHTLHEWFGVFTVIFSVLTWLQAMNSYFFWKDDISNMIFNGLSAATMVLSSITLIIGMLMDGGYGDWATCFILVMHVLMVILYTGFAIGHFVLTVFELY